MVERNTRQKQLVADAVKQLKNHPTAEEVYEFVHKSHPSVSKATVYRNLKQLSQNGKLKRIESVNLADHYDHQCYNHYHVQCLKCNKVYDAVIDYMNELDIREVTANDFRVESHDIVFKGICHKCNNKHS